MSVAPVSPSSGDLSNVGVSAGLAATLTRGPADQTLATPKKLTAIQAEYLTPA